MRTEFLDVRQLCGESFVQHVDLHETLPSTNDRALELAARADLALPAMVVARLQTAGRGRGSNIWWAADGALTFSLVLDTSRWQITQRDWPQLSIATATAVCDVLQDVVTKAKRRSEAATSPTGPSHPRPCSWLPAFSVKPPNDVLANGRKISGILLESPGGATPATKRLVVGVGINVNNSWQHAPPDAGLTGTALCDLTGQQHDVEALLIQFLQAFEQQLAAMTDWTSI